MLDIDSYLSRTFHRVRQHCWHLTRDAWLELTGVDIGPRGPADMAYEALAVQFTRSDAGFKKLDGPSDPCLVLMRSSGAVPHCGVYVRGRVLQMSRSGASFLPLEVATAGFDEVGFYT